MRVAINHETVYRYPAESNYSIQYLRLSPISSISQRVLSWKLSSSGNLRPWVDGFGNAAHVLVVEGPHQEIRVKAIGEVEIADVGKPLLADNEPHPPELYLRSTRLTEADERIQRFAGNFRPALVVNARKGLDGLLAGIRQSVESQANQNQPPATASQSLDRHAGGSREQAHLFVSCCRSLGVPARYVSGYLCSDSHEETGLATHAWAEAWVGDAGWLRYDVANRMSNAKAHVRVAVGLDYLDTAPVRGLRRGAGNEEMEIEVNISDARKMKSQNNQQ
ncbi:transglutaminase family protein [Telmatospirillum sp.]|uniref:transglutaminase family protein n=1 Tax=Telmatospirillum sp. TaxID=2079197 RepID=UPI0028457DC3|nr:transglutaminase family protein [Telmatospirillum sp.]MDR3440065.1 transglutaminase family protein [Telmatospirillum sp.]